MSKHESVKHPGLFVVKYKRKVFYDNLWTPELMEFRGLVVDHDWNIIVHPFTKIFNRGERGTDIDRDVDVIAVRKVNGFMACLTLMNGTRQRLVSTTGSLDSDFVKLAEPYILDLPVSEGYTYIFEICDPTDPHIIPEPTGAYLIGVREHSTGEMLSESLLDDEAWRMNLARPSWFKEKFSVVVDIAKKALHEGFVVYGDNKALKIKSPYYLVTKFFARKNSEKLTELFQNQADLKKTIDEEYYPLVDYVKKNIEKFVAMAEQDRIQYIRQFLWEKS